MKKAVFLIMCLIISSCGWKEISIINPSVQQEFILKSEVENPNTLILNIDSQVNGSFSINGVVIQEGNSKRDVRLDAYDQFQPVIYKPITATSGTIKNKYRY